MTVLIIRTLKNRSTHDRICDTYDWSRTSIPCEKCSSTKLKALLDFWSVLQLEFDHEVGICSTLGEFVCSWFCCLMLDCVYVYRFVMSRARTTVEID